MSEKKESGLVTEDYVVGALARALKAQIERYKNADSIAESVSAHWGVVVLTDLGDELAEKVKKENPVFAALLTHLTYKASKEFAKTLLEEDEKKEKEKEEKNDLYQHP